MNLSLNWLSEFVELDVTPKEFSDRMTMSGSKVEGYADLGAEIQNVLVGRVLSIEKHPNADKLVVTQVDVGGAKPLQIVTGAQNLKVNDLVPVAVDGAVLPGGTEIHTGALRGVESQGMMCSYQELGMSLNDFPGACEHGILVLDEGAPGEDIRPLIGLKDTVVEFEITPNRPDCLSVIGLAREAAATFDTPLNLHKPAVRGAGDNIEGYLSVRVEAPDLCPRYTARVVKNIRIAPSPKWMRHRLHAAGVRPINNIVDITNYVMLEYGQPMHAFDRACLDGGEIVVRRAGSDKTFVTLDGQTRPLDPETLVIADSKKPVGAAGIMGGENSEITPNTKLVVFESANFSGASVRVSAKKLGLRTDASARFEKGLDPENTVDAVNRACELVELLNAGDVVDGMIDINAVTGGARVIELEPEKISIFLGIEIPEEKMAEYLRRLDFQVDGRKVTVPSWRGDVVGMADLAEEVARLYGYDKIPSTLFKGETTQGVLSPAQRFERDLGAACRSVGYDEVMTYSFISPKMYDKILLPPASPLRKSTKILNPLSEEMSVMRTVALPSILEAAARNFNFRNAQAKLFELAATYTPALLPDGAVNIHVQPEERKVFLMAAYGKIDFYDFKGDLETMFSALSIGPVFFEAETANPSYHPGRCAAMSVGQTTIGVMGQVHPRVQANFGVDRPVFAAEMDFAALLGALNGEKTYEPLPKFPAVTRDLALLCDEDIPVLHLERCIAESVGSVLENLSLFDIYRGNQIPAGKKSVAFSLILRDKVKTLKDEEADEAIRRALHALEERFGAVIRA